MVDALLIEVDWNDDDRTDLQFWVDKTRLKTSNICQVYLCLSIHLLWTNVEVVGCQIK